MADNELPIPGGASARKLFPQTVAGLVVQASYARIADMCLRALDAGLPPDEIAEFLAQLAADTEAMIATARKERGE